MPNNEVAKVQVASTKSGEKKKIRSDKSAHIASSFFAWLFSLVFLALIGFIIYASVPGFQQYGFNNIIFSATFDLQDNQASVWLPLCITILSAGIAIIIAAPVGIKSAVFIK